MIMPKLSQQKIKEILQAAGSLIRMYREGKLGGEQMPEDVNPALPKCSDANYLYFPLPFNGDLSTKLGFDAILDPEAVLRQFRILE